MRLQYLFSLPQKIIVLLPSFITEVREITSTETICIPNRITDYSMYRRDRFSHRIIYVARFSPRKQQEVLINAFARICKEIPDWHLDLWGNTSIDLTYTKKIEQSISQNNLENNVHIHGTSTNILNELQKSQICVFPSRLEGLSLSLMEAMSIGLPCIGLRTTKSVNELIVHGYNGELVLVRDLYQGMKKLILDSDLQEKYAKNAKRTASQYYAHNIWPLWDSLLKRFE